MTSEAPERIWIKFMPGVVSGEFDVKPLDGAVAYVRADRIEELEDKLAKALADADAAKARAERHWVALEEIRIILDDAEPDQ